MSWLGTVTPAAAEVKLTNPAPRDPRPNEKTAPCGGAARGATPRAVMTGGTINVRWDETGAGTQGCFQIALLDNNDSTVVTLFDGMIDDPAGVQTGLSRSVTMPAGKTCSACTLQLRQVVIGGPCPAAAQPDASAMNTNYACADLCIGPSCFPMPEAGADAEPPPDPDAGATSSSSSTSSSGGDVDAGEETVFLDRGTNDCATGLGGGAGGGVLLFAALVLRRIARRANSTKKDVS
jgi:hypothetical protein